jgi:hypothetical protein
LETTAIAAAVAFAEAAGKIGGNIKNAIDGIVLVAKYSGVDLVDGVRALASDVRVMISELSNAAGLLDSSAAGAAVAFAEAAGKIGANIKNAIEGLALLMRYVGGLADTALNRFVADIEGLVRRLSDLRFDEGALAAATEFAETAGAVGANIKSAIEGIVAITEYTSSLTPGMVTAFVDDIKRVIAAFVAAINSINANDLPDIEQSSADLAAEFARVIGTIGDGISKAVAGMVALKDYAGPAQAAVSAFIADMQNIVEMFRLASLRFDAEMLAAAVGFANAAGNIGAQLKNMVDGLKALNGISSAWSTTIVGILLDRFEYVIEQLRLSAGRMAAAGVDLDAIKEFADKLAGISSAVQGLIDGVAALKDLKVVNVATIMDDLVVQFRYVLDKLTTLSGQYTAGALAQALAFASTTGAILDAIRDGIENILGIQATGGVGGVGAAMQWMVDQVTAAVGQVAHQFSTMVSNAYRFGRDWTQAIMDGLNSRLGDLEALMAYIRGLFPSSPAKYGPFANLPQGGVLGQQFAAELSQGIQAGIGGVTSSLSQVRAAMVSGASGGAAMATAPVRSRGAVNITITGNQFSSQDDVDYLLDQLDRRLRLRGGLLPL